MNSLGCIFLLIVVSSYVGATSSTKQKLILLVVDGLRWDTFNLDLPNLKKIEEEGVRADWLDVVFATLTTPNIYSIATGLYPESHGAVHNIYFDKETKYLTYDFEETVNITEWFDTGAEPIWVTAKNAGKTVGSIMYTGTAVPIKGVEPDRVVPIMKNNYAHYPPQERVRDAVKWISEDFDLVLLYLDSPDVELHRYGIEHQLVKVSTEDVDKKVGYMFQLIEDRGLSDQVNVIIAGDHGFVDTEARKFIRLYDYINKSDVEFVVPGDYGPLFQLLPKEGKLEEMYQELRNAHPALHVYKKEDFPKRLHYADHPRNLPIIGFVDPEWHVHTEWDPENLKIHNGFHGYDNRWMEMKAIFYAKGPFFKRGYRSPPLESVDLYGMMCEILDLEAAPNNGSRDRYVNMINTGSPYSLRKTFSILWTQLLEFVGQVLSI